MKKKLFLLTMATWLMGLSVVAQVTIGGLPPLHVEGNQFKDMHGNTVVLHGVMDTPSMWFNGWDETVNGIPVHHSYWTGGYDQNGTGKTNCLAYFEKQFTAITDTTQGAYCKIFRLHLDPAWTNGNDGTTTVDDREKVSDKGSEAYFGKYTPSKLTYWLPNLYFRIARKALEHGMYVIMRPPGVCPPNIYVGGSYQQYLLDVWDKVSKNDSIRKYSGQISLELANEPINVYMNDGSSSSKALHDFFQPIVDKIRENGYTGIILIPGTGWQSNYRDYVTYPIEGYNIGYAVHNYPGWYDNSDEHCIPQQAIQSFGNAVPVVKTNPIVITEVDWSPYKEGTGHYNEHGDWVLSNYGTWATASTSKWGKAYKAVLDHYGNISMTLTHPHDFFNIKKYLDTWNSRTKSGVLEPAFKEEMEANGLDVYEASSGACFQWYKEYAQKDYATKAYKRAWTADQGIGTSFQKVPMFINPILNGDFPDVDVIRVGDTYYMATTTMYHLPGATILKSKDLVNWEYCANPLETIFDNDAYNLLNGQNHYAQGMWASSLNYHNGKFYFYFPCSTFVEDGQSILLTAEDPEGKWEEIRLNDRYHDSGWLFDDGENGNGNLYVAYGINDIVVARLDPKTFKKIGDAKTVISKPDYGLEGTHMYHIGDYYYLYCTYNHNNGSLQNYWGGSQTIFRSTNPMGPYEECSKLLVDGQWIHQGALVETQTGEWWTMLMKDGMRPIGRMPWLEPVKWVDGWPVIGTGTDNTKNDVSKNGAKYKKPNVGTYYQRTYLPTNDTFTDPRLGLQWQWNHQPDNSAWSLMSRPGFLRLRTANVTDCLSQARNSLTQRILGYSPEGTTADKYLDSYGTIKMDISQMQEGDVAGLAVFQNPYSFIGVKMENGKKRIFSQRCTFNNHQHEVAETKYGDEVTADVIYLRAVVNFGDNVNTCKYFYSYDNMQWMQAGVEMKMGYTLDYFVGQRFYLFNFATQELGGYVDIDWFSTEPEYTEEMFYAPGTLKTYTEDDITMVSFTCDVTDVTMLTGSSKPLHIVITTKSGLVQDVTPDCKYQISNPDVAAIKNGSIVALMDGECTIIATYTDLMGNSESAEIHVTASTFPLTAEGFNPSISGTGKYVASTHALTTSQNGFGGWQYDSGLDLSAYNYLVVKFKRSAYCSPVFRIYDKNDYGAAHYQYEMKTKKSLVIDLHDMKTSNGATVDPSHIYMVGFSSNGSSAISIETVFLSMDGENPISTDIQVMPSVTEANVISTEVFSVDGRQIARPEKGINLIRTTYSDGKVEVKKILLR